MTDQERTNLSLESLKKIDNYALGMILCDLICGITTISKLKSRGANRHHKIRYLTTVNAAYATVKPKYCSRGNQTRRADDFRSA